jgi:transketolase
MDVWRPADTTEAAVAWAEAIRRRNGPSSLIFSRQNCTYLHKDSQQIANISKGAYVIHDVHQAQIVLMATGSEVGLAMEVAMRVMEKGISARVVSMPSTTRFDQQSIKYKSSVLPEGIPRLAIEAGVTDFWWKYGCQAVHGVDTFGESAPAGVLYKHFGLTADNIEKTVLGLLG